MCLGFWGDCLFGAKTLAIMAIDIMTLRIAMEISLYNTIVKRICNKHYYYINIYDRGLYDKLFTAIRGQHVLDCHRL